MNNPLVLVVEDDLPVRNLMTTTLKTHDYKYKTAANAAEALLMAPPTTRTSCFSTSGFRTWTALR